jgi:hypothetical protein
LTWHPGPKESEVRWGILTLIESVKPKTKCYVNRYAVVEEDHHLPGHRLFRLTKAGGTADKIESRYVELREGTYSLCDCEGHMAHGWCRHTGALETLEKAGYLEGGT